MDWLREGRFWAVISLTALHLYPVLYFNLSAALANQNPDLERAAETFGSHLAISREGRPLYIFNPVHDPIALLVIAYAMHRLPFVLRSAEAGLLQLDTSVGDAARSLGAQPVRVLGRVTLPLVLPHLMAGGVLAFALSLLEVSDSLILAQKQAFYPITKAIYEFSQLLGDGRLLASALGVWAMLLLATSVWLARRLARGRG